MADSPAYAGVYRVLFSTIRDHGARLYSKNVAIVSDKNHSWFQTYFSHTIVSHWTDVGRDAKGSFDLIVDDRLHQSRRQREVDLHHLLPSNLRDGGYYVIQNLLGRDGLAFEENPADLSPVTQQLMHANDVFFINCTSHRVRIPETSLQKLRILP